MYWLYRDGMVLVRVIGKIDMVKAKKFGVWMDNYHATIVGPANDEGTSFAIVAQLEGEKSTDIASEKNGSTQERMLQAKFFKAISSHFPNATHVHLTGTGLAQEKFMHYLSEIPQFKNIKATKCTSNRMSDTQLLNFMMDKLNAVK